MKKSKRVLIGVVIIVILFFVLIYKGIPWFDATGLILEKGGDYVLCMDNGTRIKVDGLLGTVQLSEDCKRGLFFRGTKEGIVEIAELNLITGNIKVLITAEQLIDGMQDAGEMTFEGKMEERPKSINYVNGTQKISFIWKDALYCLNLENSGIECIVQELGAFSNNHMTPLALEGQDYQWISESKLIYVTLDQHEINYINEYDLQKEKNTVVCYGSGIQLSRDRKKIICYRRYYEGGEMWNPQDILLVIDKESYKREATCKLPDEVIFRAGVDSSVIWKSKNGTMMGIYDYSKEKSVKKWMIGKKIYWIF